MKNNPRVNPITGKPSIAYRKWSSMIQRCSNPNHVAYPYYGSKGVTVHPLWRQRETGFLAFFDELGDPPKDFWIDRIDNSKGYEPGNVRWISSKESAANRTAGRNIQPNSLRQKAMRSGLSYMLVYLRIKVLGWSEEKALSTPKNPRGRISFVNQLRSQEQGKVITMPVYRPSKVELPLQS